MASREGAEYQERMGVGVRPIFAEQLAHQDPAGEVVRADLFAPSVRIVDHADVALVHRENIGTERVRDKPFLTSPTSQSHPSW